MLIAAGLSMPSAVPSQEVFLILTESQDSPRESSPNTVASHQLAIQRLSERSHASLQDVEQMYLVELSRLESHARIKQYLPLLASRRVRELLRHAQGGSSGRSLPYPDGHCHG